MGLESFHKLGLSHLRIFTVLGDDVLNKVKTMDPVVETGKPISASRQLCRPMDT